MANEDERLERETQYAEDRKADAIREINRQAMAMAIGEPGECDYCGNDSLRLVNGACARCRDSRGLE
mgnify:CR=1 FL=1